MMFFSVLFLGFIGSSVYATSGIVNFSSCVMESKYGKYEQNQLEGLKKHWASLIEETEKELSSLSKKLEDQTYLDGLSPEATENLKVKYKSLNEDMAKYQNQYYQHLNQANYTLIQKLYTKISEASESVAKQNNLDLVINKEACFYYTPKLEITTQVIDVMNKNYDQDVKDKKIEITAEAPQNTTVKAEGEAPATEKTKVVALPEDKKQVVAPAATKEADSSALPQNKEKAEVAPK